MRARIYQRPKSAMQSGRSTLHNWVLEWQRQEPQHPDPLMGWIGGGETQQQVLLFFRPEKRRSPTPNRTARSTRRKSCMSAR